jgi:predicted N-acetyltransferase YhbS
MSAIHFRLAEESDNEGIIELEKRCPQEGMITFFINRTPRFNTLHLLLDSEAWHYVACTEDKIIGLVGVVHFQANVLGKNRKIGYMLDLRVDEAYRSGTTAYRLVKTAIDHLRNSDTDMVIANFVTHNKKPLVFTGGRGGLPLAHYLGRNRILNLLPLYYMQPDNRFEIGTLRENEIPELLELYQNYSRNFKIAPIITADRFRKYLSHVDGLSPEHFLVAKENGKIKAMTALWDEHTYKSYQVLKLTPQIRMVNGLIKFLSHFIRVPHPIRINEPLRQFSLVFYAHDDCPEAINSLFRHINNITLGSEYTLIMLYTQENDPIFSTLKNFKGVSVNSEMYLFAKDTSVFEKLIEDPSTVLLDLTMIL